MKYKTGEDIKLGDFVEVISDGITDCPMGTITQIVGMENCVDGEFVDIVRDIQDFPKAGIGHGSWCLLRFKFLNRGEYIREPIKWVGLTNKEDNL